MTAKNLKCPHCGGLESFTVDSRPTAAHTAIRRRRVCYQCRQRYTTYERIATFNLVALSPEPEKTHESE